MGYLPANVAHRVPKEGQVVPTPKPDATAGGAGVTPLPQPASEKAPTGWPDAVEEALTNSSITEEHHALMSTVLQSIRSVDNGLKEALSGLLTGFKASYSAVAARAEEWAELNRKFKSSDDELDRINKWFDEALAVAAEVENLKAELRKALQEAAKQKVAAEQLVTELAMVKTTSQKHEAGVAEVQQDVKDAVTKCEDLEQKSKDQASEPTSLRSTIKEERVKA
nr:uncharacterized protein LOC120968852 [Aegilops tauschii subsp. strangulata]